MPLTNDEILDVVGDLLKEIADKLRDEETPGNLSKKEILELVQKIIVDIVSELTD
uniref:Uncharacterized protein n=1 Tax=viral metagenome TaxID=1070528 RepID=A0A6M3L839_9ZZZZ